MNDELYRKHFQKRVSKAPQVSPDYDKHNWVIQWRRSAGRPTWQRVLIALYAGLRV